MPEARRRSFSAWFRGCACRLGWRTYALPLLGIITVVAIRQPAADGHPPSALKQPAAAEQHLLLGTDRGLPIRIDGGSDATPCATNAVVRRVIVSIAKQRAWMCQSRTQVYSTLVTTGAAHVGYGTPPGTWHIQDKQRERYLVGPGYRAFVQYWMPYDGSFGFHDASWQTMPYGSRGYVVKGSHGCVHLPDSAMAWFYNWATPGTTVTIVS